MKIFSFTNVARVGIILLLLGTALFLGTMLGDAFNDPHAPAEATVAVIGMVLLPLAVTVVVVKLLNRWKKGSTENEKPFVS